MPAVGLIRGGSRWQPEWAAGVGRWSWPPEVAAGVGRRIGPPVGVSAEVRRLRLEALGLRLEEMRVASEPRSASSAARLARWAAATPAGRVARRYLDARAGTWAKVIAWNALFAFFPIVLVGVTLLGLLLHDAGFATEVERRAAAAVGGSPADQSAIASAFEAFRQRTGLLGVAGFAGLLWSGAGLIAAFEDGFSALCSCPPRSFVRQKLMSVAVILIFALLTIPLVLSSSLLALVQQVPDVPGFLTSGPLDLLLQATVGVLDGALMLGAIYLIVPNRRQDLRRVLPGAVAGGVLLEGLTLVFPLYLALSNGFATYGRTFALFFVLLTYFYLLGQIVMVGATVNAELDRKGVARR